MKENGNVWEIVTDEKMNVGIQEKYMKKEKNKD